MWFTPLGALIAIVRLQIEFEIRMSWSLRAFPESRVIATVFRVWASVSTLLPFVDMADESVIAG